MFANFTTVTASAAPAGSFFGNISNVMNSNNNSFGNNNNNNSSNSNIINNSNSNSSYVIQPSKIKSMFPTVALSLTRGAKPSTSTTTTTTNEAAMALTPKETVFGLFSGAVFNLTRVVVGHPLDLIKTRMQTTKQELSVAKILREVLAREGLRGLYSGSLAPILGTAAYRSIQFTAYEGFHANLRERGVLQEDIPGTSGLKPSIIASAFFAGGFRSIIESPIEYFKVRAQTGMSTQLRPGNSLLANIRQAYTGLSFSCIRTGGMLAVFFAGVDSAERHTSLCDSVPGTFAVGASCATMGYWLMWPFESLKNQYQAGTRTNLRGVVIRDLYRGIVPGSLVLFLGYGSAFVFLHFGRQVFSRFDTAIKSTRTVAIDASAKTPSSDGDWPEYTEYEF